MSSWPARYSLVFFSFGFVFSGQGYLAGLALGIYLGLQYEVARREWHKT